MSIHASRPVARSSKTETPTITITLHHTVFAIECKFGKKTKTRDTGNKRYCPIPFTMK